MTLDSCMHALRALFTPRALFSMTPENVTIKPGWSRAHPELLAFVELMLCIRSLLATSFKL